MTQPQDYADAAKLDILEILSSDSLGVFEFRRAQEIAKTMVLLIDSYGSPAEQGVIRVAIDEAEYKAPHLHGVLIGRAFDGQNLLNKKYAEMLEQHTELRTAGLAIHHAQSVLAQDQAEVDSNRVALAEHEKRLGIERERLQLAAGGAARLPVLPKLTRPDEDTAATKGPVPGDEWDPNTVPEGYVVGDDEDRTEPHGGRG